jgi:5-hydroxyisourate hydrolase-like protein (transthyretin family)
LTFTTPTGYTVTAQDKGTDATDSDVNATTGMTVTEELTSGENNTTYDAGYVKPASLGNYTWIDANANGIQDPGEQPISGVTVQLTGTDGAGNPVTATTTTNALGEYLFSNLLPGTYKVTFTAPSGYTTTFPDKGTDATDSDADRTTGMTVTEVLTSGENNLTYDAGYFQPASIGNYVWDDKNGNGIQDAGETGIPGVTVTLTGTDAQGNPVSVTTTTDPSGAYNFPNLVPGTYKLTFVTPAGYTVTAQDKGSDNLDSDVNPATNMTIMEVLTSGENNTTYDAGYFKPASLGNYTWIDADANGVQDAGEQPIAGVIVTLTGTDGAGNTVTATTTTDSGGQYLFSNLAPGTYKVTFTAPTGYTTTFPDKGANDATDSDADRTTGMTVTEVLESGENNLTYDAGYFQPASIGDLVWEDKNGNGIQDAGEPGISGVTVTLTGTDGNGTPVSLTTTTNGSGAYNFPNLVPGTYKLTFTTPTGYSVTSPDKTTDNLDSDVNPTTSMTVTEVLTTGENNTTYDAGYFKPASLGNYTWIDANANGIQDPGEQPISGVTVTLTGTDGAGNPVTATTTTNALGEYLFSNLAPGTYKVTFTAPTGYTTTFPDKGAMPQTAMQTAPRA